MDNFGPLMVQLLQQFATDARMRDLYSRGLKLFGDEGKIASQLQKAVWTCSLSSKVINRPGVAGAVL